MHVIFPGVYSNNLFFICYIDNGSIQFSTASNPFSSVISHTPPHTITTYQKRAQLYNFVDTFPAGEYFHCLALPLATVNDIECHHVCFHHLQRKVECCASLASKTQGFFFFTTALVKYVTISASCAFKCVNGTLPCPCSVPMIALSSIISGQILAGEKRSLAILQGL